MLRIIASVGFSLAVSALVAPALAAPVPFFTETFESGPATSVLNAPTIGQFSATLGTVDFIRIPNGFSIESCGAGGNGCVDLAGSTGAATSQIATALLDFQPGSYVLSFDLSGSQRDASADSVNVLIPGIFGPLTGTRGGAEGFATLTVAFVVTVATNAAIIFEGLQTADNVGLLLDNILVTFDANVVPLPGAFPLLLAGIAGLAFASRRQRRI